MNWTLILVILTASLLVLLRIDLRKLRLLWLWFKLKRDLEGINSPESRLKSARDEVQQLQIGHYQNLNDQKTYLSAYDITLNLIGITKAMQIGFSYTQLGTTQEEVIGFRNGEAHKTSGKAQLEEMRKHGAGMRGSEISELAKEGRFSLAEIGTTEAELEALEREAFRRTFARAVNSFREWATGDSDFCHDPEEFKGMITRVVLEEDGCRFSYEDLDTSEAEIAELLRLAWRRKVVDWINFLKRKNGEEKTNNEIVRNFIHQALNKARANPEEFGITEAQLDELGRNTQ